jgi:hypothetical protein
MLKRAENKKKNKEGLSCSRCEFILIWVARVSVTHRFKNRRCMICIFLSLYIHVSWTRRIISQLCFQDVVFVRFSQLGHLVWLHIAEKPFHRLPILGADHHVRSAEVHFSWLMCLLNQNIYVTRQRITVAPFSVLYSG